MLPDTFEQQGMSSLTSVTTLKPAKEQTCARAAAHLPCAHDANPFNAHFMSALIACVTHRPAVCRDYSQAQQIATSLVNCAL
jgi:hypothetical protein